MEWAVIRVDVTVIRRFRQMSTQSSDHNTSLMPCPAISVSSKAALMWGTIFSLRNKRQEVR